MVDLVIRAGKDRVDLVIRAGVHELRALVFVGSDDDRDLMQVTRLQGVQGVLKEGVTIDDWALPGERMGPEAKGLTGRMGAQAKGRGSLQALLDLATMMSTELLRSCSGACGVAHAMMQHWGI